MGGDLTILYAMGPAQLPGALRLTNGAYLEVSRPIVPVGSTPYTLEAWIKPESMGALGIMGWGDYGRTNRVNALRLSERGIINYWWSNDLVVDTPDLVGVWSHVAVTCDGVTRTMFLNGARIGADRPVGHNATPHNFRIGSTNGGEFFNGLIAQVRVWGRARTPGEIELTRRAQIVSGPGLLGSWRLDEVDLDSALTSQNRLRRLLRLGPESAAVTLRDSSGAQQHASLRGEARTQPVGDLLIDPVPRGGTPVLWFEGAGSYVSAEIDVPETGYTAMIWFWTRNGDCGLFSVDAGDRGAQGHDRHIYLAEGNLRARVWSDEVISSSGANFADGRWHCVTHVMGSRTGGQRLYVDGELAASGSKQASDFHWQNGVNIGYSNDARTPSFDGALAEVVLWSRELSPAEIRNSTSRELLLAARMLAHWRFREGQGPTTRDWTGNGHTGTLHGAPIWSAVPNLPVVSRGDPGHVRAEAERLAQAGSSLGQGHRTDPPQPLPERPVAELRAAGELPQWDLRDQLQQLVSGDRLVLEAKDLGPFAPLWNLQPQLLPTRLEIRHPRLALIKGQAGLTGTPGMEITGEEQLATPENCSLRLTGETDLLGRSDGRVQLDFFAAKATPHASLRLNFAGSDASIRVDQVFTWAPLLGNVRVVGPTVIASTSNVLYDPKLDSGINRGLNAFGNIKPKDSENQLVQFLGAFLQAEDIGLHAAIDPTPGQPTLLLEGAVQRQVVLLESSQTKLTLTRNDIAFELTGTPPKASLTVSCDVALRLPQPDGVKHLIFTGGVKLEAQSVTAFFTMNGTGRSPEGKLSGEIQNTDEWNEPFGVPGVAIRQMSLQLGVNLAGTIDSVGVHGVLRIQDLAGSASILVDVTNPDEFVLAGSLRRATLLQLLAATSPAGLLAYSQLSEGAKRAFQQVVDVALENVRLYHVPKPCSIGGVHFRQAGTSAQGSLIAWGWRGSARMTLDPRDGVDLAADMDRIDLFNGAVVLKGTGGETSPRLRLKLLAVGTRELRIALGVSLLGLGVELDAEANEHGMTCRFERGLGSLGSTALDCRYGQETFAASGNIDFRINTSIPSPFGNIPLNVGLAANTSLEAGRHTGFQLSLAGRFDFWGRNLTLPTLTLSVAPQNFEALYNALIKLIIDKAGEVFLSALQTLEEWTRAVGEGVVVVTRTVAQVAREVYHATEEQAARAYKALGYGANAAMEGLRTTYSLSAEGAAEAARAAGFAGEAVFEALQTVFGLSAQTAAEIGKAVGYALEELGEEARQFLQGVADVATDVGNALNPANW